MPRGLPPQDSMQPPRHTVDELIANRSLLVRVTLNIPAHLKVAERYTFAGYYESCTEGPTIISKSHWGRGRWKSIQRYILLGGYYY
jgi:hypothetical protein